MNEILVNLSIQWGNDMKHFKSFFVALILIINLTMITACGKIDDRLTILLFSNITQEEVIQGKNGILFEDESIVIKVYPALLEKAVMEIAAHSGDLLIVENDMLQAIFDPVGIHSLDSILDSKDSYQEYAAENEDGSLSVYAVPVKAEHKMFESVTVNAELVAVVPKYSKNEDAAFSILKQLLKVGEE